MGRCWMPRTWWRPSPGSGTPGRGRPSGEISLPSSGWRLSTPSPSGLCWIGLSPRSWRPSPRGGEPSSRGTCLPRARTWLPILWAQAPSGWTWVRDSMLRVRRFDGYFLRGLPRLDAVEFRFVPDSAVKAAGLVAGDFDVVDAVSPLDLPRLARDPRVVVRQEPSATVNVVAVNNARPPFTDVRVRRALWHAIDRRAVLKTAYGPGSVPVAVFLDARSPSYVDMG